MSPSRFARVDPRLVGTLKLPGWRLRIVLGCIAAVTIAAWARSETTPVIDALLPQAVDPSVPTPESIIGHRVGDGAARYDDVERYVRALADASPLVTLTEYATSHEGRKLYYLTITSSANHARLAQIKADNGMLADPRRLQNTADADRIIDAMPAIAWLAYSIHGDELSGTDASMLAAYALAAGTDETTRRLRDELVIHIDPSQNPDGRERYLSQLQPLTGKVPNTDYQALQHAGLWSAGRGNHYLFDLNRDWLPQVHAETRGRTAAMLEWNPHLVIDAHEMGSLDTYLFDPPREPFNINLSEDNMKWRRRFSADQARAFDRHGWSYYTQEWYEEWYPGYTNAWANLLGAIGLLYEQAGVNGAAVKQPSGTVLTYEEAVAHQYASSMANLETLRAHRRDILRDYFADRRWAINGTGEGPMVLLVPPVQDRAKLDRFTELLRRQGIEFQVSTGPVAGKEALSSWGDKSDRVELPAGTIIVQAAQPHRRLLKSILEFDPRMSDKFLFEERKSLENHQGTRVYDTTAWNVPMAYGLDAYWAASFTETDGGGVRDAAPDDPFAAKPAYGYLIDGQSSDIFAAIVRLTETGCHVRVARKPFTIGKRDYAAGGLLLRNHENPADLARLLRDAATDLKLTITALDTGLCESGPDLGGQEYDLLQPSRIAVASQWPTATTSFGSIWHLLDAQLGLRCSPINLQSIGGIDLRKYNVLVLPDSWGASGLGAILNEGVRGQLKSWIEAGGTLVAVGNSAAFVAGKDNGLSAVRLRPDVLDKLAVYDEAVTRERSARKIEVDPNAVWGSSEKIADTASQASAPTAAAPVEKASAESPAAKKDAADGKGGKPESGGDAEALKRKDAWQRTFSPNGVFVRADLNPEHWLCFGLGDRLPVLIGGANVFMSSHPVATPARLADKNDLRLAGLLWPEARERMANSAYATVERMGRGQIILLADDPIFRGYTEGTGRLFLNAVILGPGLGTSQTVPW